MKFCHQVIPIIEFHHRHLHHVTNVIEHKTVAKIYPDDIVGKGNNMIPRLFAQEYFHDFLGSLTERTLNQASCVSQTQCVYDGPLSTSGVKGYSGDDHFSDTSKGGKF